MSSPLLAALLLGLALVASTAVIGIGGMIISKRPETNSLFVEDRVAFAVVKIGIGLVVIGVGISGFCTIVGAIARVFLP